VVPAANGCEATCLSPTNSRSFRRLLVELGVENQCLERQDGRLRRAEAAEAAALLTEPLDRLLDGGVEFAGVGFQPAEQGQRGCLDLQITAAGAGDARLLGVEMAVRLLQLRRLFQQRDGVGRLGPVDEAVGDESKEVRIFGRFGFFAEGVQFLADVVVLAAFGQRPDDVGVGDVLRRSAEGVEGARIAFETALAVALVQQVFLRPPHHVLIDVMDLGHVAELHQAVGRQRLVGRSRAAEPLIAFLGLLGAVETLERG
jgi:hypothetical protein